MKANNILETIGNTPHVRLNKLYGNQQEVWIKLEKTNPGASIKDRIALAMIEDAEQKGLLKLLCTYPESAGLEDHLQMIKSEIAEFKPSRIAIDSLSALARGVSNNAFRQFVIGVTGFAKQEEITGFFTNTSDQFMGSNSITDSHISTITDTIIMLQYVEIRGEMSRAINVFKMRGSWHDKGIREYTITDNGIGIPGSDLPYIFDRFYRVQSDRSRQTGGTGLGLAIVQGIITSHQGSIKVESKINQGTTFKIYLPLQKGQPTEHLIQKNEVYSKQVWQ